jgi:hypothetical protein
MSPRLAEATAGAAPGMAARRWAYASSLLGEAATSSTTSCGPAATRHVPVHAPRWDVELPDAYGIGPGIEAIGDMRQLQVGELRLAQIIDRVSGKGPLTGPPLAGGLSDLGGETYVPIAVGTQGGGVRPLYEIPPAAVQLVQELMRVEQRIHTHVLQRPVPDAGRDRAQRRDGHRDQRAKEEKLVVLGPVVMRTTEELLDPPSTGCSASCSASRSPAVALEPGPPLPPPPQELAVPS